MEKGSRGRNEPKKKHCHCSRERDRPDGTIRHTDDIGFENVECMEALFLSCLNVTTVQMTSID